VKTETKRQLNKINSYADILKSLHTEVNNVSVLKSTSRDFRGKYVYFFFPVFLKDGFPLIFGYFILSKR